MDLSDYSWKDCPDTGRSTGAQMIFYQGGPTDHGKHVTGPVSQSSAERYYNASCTVVMALAHFRMLIYELLNTDTYIVPETSTSIILDSKSTVCIANIKTEYHMMDFMILVVKIVQTLAEVQENKLYFIRWAN